MDSAPNRRTPLTDRKMSLKQKTISGLFWTFAEQFAIRGIGFIVQVVLARILLPEEFGLIAMIMVFIGIGHSLVDSGMTQSLIRTVNPDQRDYSTVFFINIAVSVLVYGIICVSAPAISRFYEQDILTAIVRVYALIIIIQSFVTVQITRMTKEMNFRIQMVIQVPSVIAGGIVGIVMALYGWGVWALVYMALVRTLVSTLLYWFNTGWRPDWVIDRDRLWYHFNFGYKLTLSGILNTVYTNAYNIVIGKMFSASQLGFYSKADEMQRFPVRTMSAALNKVTYPMFSQVQNDNEKLRNTYRRLMQQVLYWVTPALTLGVVLAVPLFRLILTEKWLPAVPYFRILCIVGLLYPIQAYNLNILNVKGRSDLFLRLEIIKKLVITIGIILVIPFGIYGLLYFQVINSLVAYGINTHYSGRFIDYPAISQLRDILPVIIQAILPGVLLYLLIYLLLQGNQWPDVTQILAILISYLLIYFGLSHWLKTAPYIDFKNLVVNRFIP